ncbi:MAG: hypothetical protein HKN07_00770 [Acidimicrobiia bacterium]|nr:hypothetical protein [Acidimicrobiia bacterium]
MNTGHDHLVWFERPILPHLLAEIDGSCTIIGPGAPTEPSDDLTPAMGVVASLAEYDDEVFDRAPNLRVIARTGIGYDKVDVAAATRRGIAVCNVPDGPTVSTAEHTMALMLAAAKNVKQSHQRLIAGESDFYARHHGMQLMGKRLGLVGFGRIARRVAVAARALDMEVVVFDPHLDPTGVDPKVDAAASLETLVGEADVVSVHIPLTEQTRYTFSRELFARFKPGSIFVNSARGGLVDLDALIEALDSGQLLAAGLDVTEPEPLPPGHRLLERDDVVVTPHVAAATPEARRANFIGAVEQVIDVLEGRRPPHLVNPHVWNTQEGA